jgi:NAD(P)-dependent dehydrogenase (short-subunit alcohol dehydrogenase family)
VPQGRVVMLSSTGHASAPKAGIEFDNLSGEKHYRPLAAYGQSKLANILFAVGLARRLTGTTATANALHPGVIATNLGRHLSPVLGAVFRILSFSPLLKKHSPRRGYDVLRRDLTCSRKGERGLLL